MEEEGLLMESDTKSGEDWGFGTGEDWMANDFRDVDKVVGSSAHEVHGNGYLVVVKALAVRNMRVGGNED
ncbi:hypothetical protein SUGI_0082530 [Cryptomeria japonica]|nr:hypothetical protein SUGI_0082530 [Cryptomeria japonica]